VRVQPSQSVACGELFLLTTATMGKRKGKRTQPIGKGTIAEGRGRKKATIRTPERWAFNDPKGRDQKICKVKRQKKKKKKGKDCLSLQCGGGGRENRATSPIVLCEERSTPDQARGGRRKGEGKRREGGDASLRNEKEKDPYLCENEKETGKRRR